MYHTWYSTQFGEAFGPIEDVPEPIVGYRWWKISPTGRLVSCSSPTVWPRKVDGGLVARCLRERRLHFKSSGWDSRTRYGALGGAGGYHKDRDAPCFPANSGEHFMAGCGIYAMKNEEGMLGTGSWSGCVAGRVLLGGRVIEHRNGYRAQYAIVDALYRPDPEEGDIADPPMEPVVSQRIGGRPMPVTIPYATSLQLETLASWYEVPIIDCPQIWKRGPRWGF